MIEISTFPKGCTALNLRSFISLKIEKYGSLGLLWNIMSVRLMCWCAAIRKGKHRRLYDPSLSSWKPGRQPEAVSLPLAHWAGKPGPSSSDHASQALWRDCLVSYSGRPLRALEILLNFKQHLKLLFKVKCEGEMWKLYDNATQKKKSFKCVLISETRWSNSFSCVSFILCFSYSSWKSH